MTGKENSNSSSPAYRMLVVVARKGGRGGEGEGNSRETRGGSEGARGIGEAEGDWSGVGMLNGLMLLRRNSQTVMG